MGMRSNSLFNTGSSIQSVPFGWRIIREHTLWLRTGVQREISNITSFYILGGNENCDELRVTGGFLLTSTGSGYQITFSCLSRWMYCDQRHWDF